MWSDLLYRIRAIFRRNSMERELDEELRFHIDKQIARHTESGLPRAEAERQARLEFGGIEQVKEQSRHGRGIALVEVILQDFRYGARVLRKSPGFTLVAALSLALGIGANTAIFQLLDAIRLRSLPVPSPHELAQIRIADVSRARGSFSGGENAVTYAIWEQIRKHQQPFSGVFAWYETSLNLSPAGEVRRAPGLYVSGEYFQTLGIAPALGRLLSPADDVLGCGLPGAVISHSFWQSEFGGRADAIGRSLILNGHSVPVIGVTPPEFSGLNVGRTFEIAVPICSVSTLWFDLPAVGTIWWLRVMGRLKPGWSVERAAAQLNSVSPAVFEASLPSNYPTASVQDYLALQLTSVPAAAGLSGLRAQYSAPLWMLLAIAGLVMLIACANLANLMLARASARDREIAVRLAIGASRRRLIGQLMVESLLLAGAGAGIGLFVSGMLGRALISLLNTAEDFIYLDLRADWRVLAFTAGLAVLTSLLFGLTPALRATRSGPGAVLKSASRGLTTGRERFELRRLLLASQVALSLVLLVGALLFVQSLRNLVNTETGFRPEGIMIADLGFARPDPSKVKVASFQKTLLERIQSIPGVISVADVFMVPLNGGAWDNRVWMDGSDPSRSAPVLFNRVSSGYFRTLNTPMLQGRDFNDHDTQDSPKVAIVNEAFARRVAGSGNAIGRSFRVEATPSVPETQYEIIGLAGNAKYVTVREDFEPIAYLAYSQDPNPSLTDQLLIRSSLSSARLLPALRRAIGEADPEARFAFREFQDQIRDSLLPERLMATISSAFGILAAVLSAIGIYGVIAYLVACRRNEIGVRMALGAGRREIQLMVISESVRIVAVGVAAGAVLSLFAATLAKSMLFGLTSYDLRTFITAAVLLLLVGLFAAYVPARRAASIDPTIALRED